MNKNQLVSVNGNTLFSYERNNENAVKFVKNEIKFQWERVVDANALSDEKELFMTNLMEDLCSGKDGLNDSETESKLKEVESKLKESEERVKKLQNYLERGKNAVFIKLIEGKL